MSIKNYMMDLVGSHLDKIAATTDACLCDRCRDDIMALALNHLPSKYIVSEEGEVFAKVSSFHQQAEIDVISATAKAIMTVSKNPRHV
jgi:competence protein ComFB